MDNLDNMKQESINNLLSGANPKQWLIFCMALYITAPEDVAESDLQSIMDDVTTLEQYFVSMDTPVEEIDELKMATKVLVDVEGFPNCSVQAVEDILSIFETSV